jgi:hypothetical protein
MVSAWTRALQARSRGAQAGCAAAIRIGDSGAARPFSVTPQSLGRRRLRTPQPIGRACHWPRTRSAERQMVPAMLYAECAAMVLQSNATALRSDRPDARQAVWIRWRSFAGYAAAVWSLIYGLLGLYWTFGGGFPVRRRRSRPGHRQRYVDHRRGTTGDHRSGKSPSAGWPARYWPCCSPADGAADAPQQPWRDSPGLPRCS